ncbi:hemerythrin domain-containing protein [Ramlibacter sp.]|uniref:hemerythrin domain-containing protein n=1 Tax=Ramlibacter sp. TaxID=1917967 RepID=UPI002C307EAA|nr:hemerythrin domain-containing protein [Ramlibacter sp.]HWI83348.1 hemerythrin domain-containing protein [Ramlibacter sp.]
MNIDKFKHQHVEILNGIEELRRLARQGIAQSARTIAARVVSLSSVVRLHLAVEDRVLYPSVEATGDERLKSMSRSYQEEMDGIATAYLSFAARWHTAPQIEKDPEGFRASANVVLKQVFERMQRENREFYPAIEAAAVPA